MHKDQVKKNITLEKDQSGSISNMRKDYNGGLLLESELLKNPIQQFEKWFLEARQSEELEPNAMVLSTVDVELQTSSRVVLLKGFSDSGFVFYTNYGSKKSRDIELNPKVSLVFNWLSLQRQVRVEGIAKKTSREQSVSYFESRPRSSQLGAWTSRQSKVLKKRYLLENRYSGLEKNYEGVMPLPCPTYWGGYVIVPMMLEFWQGRTSRLHDRLRYLNEKRTGDWIVERLEP